jgi:hypothetical protein
MMWAAERAKYMYLSTFTVKSQRETLSGVHFSFGADGGIIVSPTAGTPIVLLGRSTNEMHP